MWRESHKPTQDEPQKGRWRAQVRGRPGPGREADSRDGGHVVVKLGQEAGEAERLVHADDVLQLPWGLSREGNPPLPGNQTGRPVGYFRADANELLPGAGAGTPGPLPPTPPTEQTGKRRPGA